MSTSVLMQRPILGGVFGSGTYALASISGVARGLHAVRYLVINPRSGVVVSAAPEKAEAIAAARRVILATSTVVPVGVAANDAQYRQLELFPEDPTPPKPPAARISRRRRQVFDRSEGRCAYCSRPLTLDGRWHVEHAQPKALGGTDDPLNLVAACGECNLAKADRTALEYVALRGVDGSGVSASKAARSR